MVFGHVVLELLGVGARRRLPARDFVDGIEVVGEVLRIGVAHFPVGRKTGVSLRVRRLLVTEELGVGLLRLSMEGKGL